MVAINSNLKMYLVTSRLTLRCKTGSEKNCGAFYIVFTVHLMITKVVYFHTNLCTLTYNVNNNN
jgi:hypothetical protein